MNWDIQKLERDQLKGGRKVKVFKGGECTPCYSLSHARKITGFSRYQIKKAIESGEPIDGYYFEFW